MLRLLLVAVALAVLGQTPAAAEAPMRVMTFNVRYDNPDDGPNAWPHRRGAVAALIRFHDPDVLGLQEVLAHQREQIAADLPVWTLIGVGRDDGARAGEFSPIAFRADRFALREHGVFWLSRTPERPSKGWDADLPRIVTWARLVDRATARALLVLNTHWDHKGAQARLESASMMREFASTRRTTCDTVVLLGDFNAALASQPIQRLLAPGPGAMVDARTVAEAPPMGPIGTGNGWLIAREDAPAIDHVFVDPEVRVVRFGVITQHELGRLPSDHYPVVADLDFPPKSACGAQWKN